MTGLQPLHTHALPLQTHLKHTHTYTHAHSRTNTRHYTKYTHVFTHKHTHAKTHALPHNTHASPYGHRDTHEIERSVRPAGFIQNIHYLRRHVQLFFVFDSSVNGQTPTISPPPPPKKKKKKKKKKTYFVFLVT